MLAKLQQGFRNDFADFWWHVRTKGLRETILWLKSREAPVTFQFLKYAALGVFTTLVQLLFFTWFSHSLFPAHDYLDGGALPDALKERNAILSNLLAFPLAMVFNYFVNVIFVFTPGRHSRWREFGLFALISSLTFGVGLLCGPALISRGLDPWIAQGGLVVSSALLNFICRKYLVFLK